MLIPSLSHPTLELKLLNSGYAFWSFVKKTKYQSVQQPKPQTDTDFTNIPYV